MSESQKPKVIITGCSGLIGSRLTKRLANDYDLIGVDLNEPKDLGALIHFVKMDLTKDEGVSTALDQIRTSHGHRIASVLHLAAYYDFSGEPSPLYDELTVEGTRRLIEQFQTKSFDVEQFVFSSSLLVMDPDEHGRRLTEFSNTRAEWAYPESKLKAEAVLKADHGAIPIVLLRIAGVYDEECNSLPISQQITRIYEKQLESYFFPGDKSHGQALVHLDDLADCFAKVIERRKRLDAEEMFLIAEPDVMSYEELQDKLGELIHGKEWPTIRIPKVAAKAGAWVKNKLASNEQAEFIKPWMVDLADDHYAVIIAHAKATLDWEPTHRLRDTIPAIVDSLKRDPKAFYQRHGLKAPESVS